MIRKPGLCPFCNNPWKWNGACPKHWKLIKKLAKKGFPGRQIYQILNKEIYLINCLDCDIRIIPFFKFKDSGQCLNCWLAERKIRPDPIIRNYFDSNVIDGKLHCYICVKEIKDRRRTYHCDNKCRDIFYNRYSWNWIRYRILNKCNYTCQKCKERPKYSWDLEVHHIKAVSEGGSFFNDANLTLLCKKCHAIETKKLAYMQSKKGKMIKMHKPLTDFTDFNFTIKQYFSYIFPNMSLNFILFYGLPSIFSQIFN